MNQPPKAKGSRTSLLETAGEAIRHGRLDEAEKLVRKVLKARPREADALYLLGLVRHFQHRPGDAEDLLRRALKRTEAPQYFTALGETLRARGKLTAAEKAYDRALALAPHDHDALYNLANLKMTQQDYATAANLFSRVSQLVPHDAEIVSAFGLAKAMAGEFGVSRSALQKAARMRPDNAVIRFNLAVGLHFAGDWAEAAAAARQYLEQDPDDPEILYIAAHSLAHTGDNADQALAALERYCDANPEDTEARARLGHCYAAGGQFARAADAYRAILQVDPDNAFARLRLLGLNEYEPDAAELNEMIGAAGSEKLSADDKASLCFGLARILERHERYEEAFEFLRRANTARGASRPWDRAEFSRQLAALKRVAGTDFTERHAGAASGDERPVFILGMPRSGSTLVEQILAAHPQVTGAGELPNILGDPASFGLDASAAWPDFLETIADKQLADGRERYLERLDAVGRGAPRVTDKLPSNFLNLPVIAATLPKAKIIHSLRDPLDTCFSCYTTDFGAGQGFTFDLEALGEYFRLYQELMAYWRETLPIPILDVGYEALVENPREEAARMLDFCGLPWDDACLEPHKAERPVFTASMWQVRQPIYAGAKGRAEPFRQWLEPALGWARAPE